MKSFLEYAGEWGTKELTDKYKKDTPGEKKEALKKKKDDPCWKGYAQLGTKKSKSGKEVPNCVPIEEATKGWKKIKSYLLGKPADVYTNDSGYTFGKVDGRWVMVDFDDEIIHVDKSAAAMKRYYNSNLTEEVAANNVGSGMVDMNPTGLQKNDKRRKYQCDRMFRRANGLDSIMKMLKAKQELADK